MAEIHHSIFKQYDIRGVYPSELNEEAAFCTGLAFAKFTKAKKVVLAQDARVSSPALFKAFARGLNSGGAKVHDIGQMPTECLYFAVGFYDFDAGAMITASHNPKEYNGIKMITKDGKGNIAVVRGKELEAHIDENAKDDKSDVEIAKKDIWKEYEKHVLSFVDLSQLSPFKVVVDASNGVAGHVVSKLQEKLPIEIIPIHFDPDGNFPNHSPNPLIEGSVDDIQKAILKHNADFGFIFDGDADRVFLIDEQGKLVRADATLLLLAKHFLDKNKGMGIAYNAICSKAVPEFVKTWGGVPLRTQVGFVNVREALIEHQGIMGGELSGHYCFKDNYYMDSGMVAFLTVLSIISTYPSLASGQLKVSEIVKELSPYVKSPELNFTVKDKDAVLERVKETFSDAKQDYLDGVTVTYKDWWFNVRPSNTEPLLRLTIEADTQELLDKKQKELIKLIK